MRQARAISQETNTYIIPRYSLLEYHPPFRNLAVVFLNNSQLFLVRKFYCVYAYIKCWKHIHLLYKSLNKSFYIISFRIFISTFDFLAGSQIASWFPSFSVEVMHARVQNINEEQLPESRVEAMVNIWNILLSSIEDTSWWNFRTGDSHSLELDVPSLILGDSNLLFWIPCGL